MSNAVQTKLPPTQTTSQTLVGKAMDYRTFIISDDVLAISETFWKTHYLWLKDKGYQLRPRYAPDWKASWKGTNKSRYACEDGISLKHAIVCDAIHIASGTPVGLKQLDEEVNPLEKDIHLFLSSDLMLMDPRNHSVPLLEVLHPPDKDPSTRILVMPLLRPFDSPIFDTFGEAVECIRQLFEGVQFMHEHHVTHRDIKMTNFMMESQAMFPEGYHPQKNSFDALDYGLMRKPDLSGPAKFFTRTQRPPKYYLIDFGLSRLYDADNTSPREIPILGGDKTVPEFDDPEEPQNPYWTDVYYAGNLVRQYFIQGHPINTGIRGYRGFGFLNPLINDMVQNDPSKRPTMDEVVSRFQLIIDNMSSWKLRSRTSSRRASLFEEILLFISHWKRRVGYIFNRTPAIPRPSIADYDFSRSLV